MKDTDVSAYFKGKDKATTIIVGNQKGGVSKTTNTLLIAYNLALLGVKTLIVDTDPQSNATRTMLLTKVAGTNEPLPQIKKTLMAGIKDGNLLDLPIEIKDNLYLLPNYKDFKGFAKYIYKNTKTEEQEINVLNPLFEPLKKEFDVILIDVPPMNDEITKNVAVVSDFVLISLQTQENSYTGTVDYIEDLTEIKNNFNLKVDVIGILATLFDNRGPVDKMVLQSVYDTFGKENVFDTVVRSMARIKRFSVTGITKEDYFDEAVLNVFKDITIELVERLEKEDK